jgi:hypothetical protein
MEVAMNILKNQLAGFGISATKAMLTVVSIPAVVHSQSVMPANIPFDFYIGSQRLPSGTYNFEVSGMYVKLADRDGHSAIALASMVPNPESKTLIGGKLMFTRYDNYYFLSEMRRAGYTTGLGMIRSSLEAQIAKSSGERQLLAFGTPK